MHVKFKIDNTTLPTMAEYGTLQVKEPTLFKIYGTNGGVLKLSTQCYLWMNEEDYFRLERIAQLEYNNDSKPQQSSTVTAKDLLKAIAITKDSTLAVQLLKD